MTAPTMADTVYATDRTTAPWAAWCFVWRPLRRRWCLVLDAPGSRPWTPEELDVEPSLARVGPARPTAWTFGTFSDAMDHGAKLIPPFMDVLQDSPFWTRPLGKIS